MKSDQEKDTILNKGRKATVNLRSQVAPSHYFRKEYDSKGRFCSYWHSIDEIRSLDPESVLEVGIGNGFVSDYLKKRRINVVALDIDERLDPDCVGSVLDLPFLCDSFEIVACFEVLEHLPYEDFPRALSELYRVSNSHVVLSLPDLSRVCRLYICLPKAGELKMLIPLPRLKPLIRKFDGGHYWNIGTAGYPFRKVVAEIRQAGFEVEKSYRVFEISWHRSFVLRKTGG